MAAPIKVIDNYVYEAEAGPNVFDPHLLALPTGYFQLGFTATVTVNDTDVVRQTLRPTGAHLIGVTNWAYGPANNLESETSLATNGPVQLMAFVDDNTANAGTAIRIAFSGPLETDAELTTTMLVSGEANGEQHRPEVAALTDGRFAIVWVQDDNVVYRIFDPATHEFAAATAIIGTNASGNGDEGFDLGVVAIDRGDFAVTYRNDSLVPMVTVVDGATGTATTPRQLTALGGPTDIAFLADGHLLAVYTDADGISARTVDTNGVPGSASTSYEGVFSYPVITALHDGRAMAVFVDMIEHDILGVILNPDGTADSEIFDVAVGVVDNYDAPSIITLADGRVVVSYESSAGEIENVIFDPREAGVELVGTTGNDWFIGSRFGDRFLMGNGNDSVDGGEGDDDVNGGAGDDSLWGSAGNDTLAGGRGDDLYVIVDSIETLVELNGQGADRVRAQVNFTLAEGVYIESISTYNSNGTEAIDLTGNSLAQELRGNIGDNRLNGGGGADTLLGDAGNDTYTIVSGQEHIVETVLQGADRVQTNLTYALEADISIEYLSATSAAGTSAINLTGNDLSQEITGNAGNNRLDGRAGIDTLVGLGGSDTLIVDNAGDIVIEALNGGTDRVSASVSYALAAGQHVERMSTTNSSGTTAIELTGNELVQEITGNAGNNRLDGRGGADTLIGAAGNDTLIVDNAADIVIENANEGTDRVGASVTYTLAAGQHVERMTTTNSAGITSIHLTGNEFAQEMTGNHANNWLTGAGGLDQMTGSLGNDTFDFNAVSESGITAGTADIVLDFTDAGGEQDRINVATIDANTATGANDAFVLDLDASFSTGEIRQSLVNGGTDLLVEFNNDADAAADMAILLDGRIVLLDAADFVF